MTVGSTTSAINFGSTSQGTNTLSLTYTGYSVPSVTNLAPGDEIVFPNDSWNTGIQWVENSDGNYTIYDAFSTTNSGDAFVKSVTLAPGVSTSDFSWNNTSYAIVCFLSGTMIRTPDGERAVETLELDDIITVFDPGTSTGTAGKITWAGRRHVTVRRNLPDDEAGYPVRILADAIAPGTPRMDLLVTPEHCLFLNERFVPARMLVNGSSIFYDHAITQYTYHHVETERHAVIWANDMPTESYLDTGNRRFMEREGKVSQLTTTPPRSWKQDAAAPLAVSREQVEPLFRRIAERAEAAGCTSRYTAPELTEDPCLQILTDKGISLTVKDTGHGWFQFPVPAGTQSVRLLSRSSRPCDVIGPFVDDRRALGVLVGDVLLHVGTMKKRLTPHLRTDDLFGWHNREQGEHRWTTGNAVFPLSEKTDEEGVMFVNILSSGPYSLHAGHRAERLPLSA
nr:Hint domain-containing protein [Acetobacter estunensis]